MQHILNKLKIKPLPCYEKFYKEAMDDFNKNGTYIADDERISECITKYGILKNWQAELSEAAKGIRNNEALLKFVYLLKHVLTGDDVFDELLEITLPGEDTPHISYDFAPMFSLFPLLSLMVDNLEKRNLPPQLIVDCMKEFDENTDIFFRQYQRPGIRERVVWLYKFIHGQILRVGRLNFEIFKEFDGNLVLFKSSEGEFKALLSGEAVSGVITETETDYVGVVSDAYDVNSQNKVTLSKDKWKPVLKKGDMVVSVHIPSGDKLLPEECEASNQKMQEILKTYYPDYKYIMFVCEHSWLMDPHLEDYLKPNSNIMAFQKNYMLYRNNANGMGVFDFLFCVPHKTPIPDLPEDSSLRKSIKELYLSGGKILEQGGLLTDTFREEIIKEG